MSMLRNTLPASLRVPVPVQSRSAYPQKSTLTVGVEVRAISMTKSDFSRLPQEPEDARLTGATRSLNRRLLALNVPGSLRMSPHDVLPVAKIA
jgi:hypothetical protein